MEVFADGSWMPKMLGEMEQAVKISVASMLFDDPEVTACLSRRLKSAVGPPVSVMVVVDKQNATKNLCRPHVAPACGFGCEIGTPLGLLKVGGGSSAPAWLWDPCLGLWGWLRKRQACH